MSHLCVLQPLFSYGSESDLTTVIDNRFWGVNYVQFHIFETINDFIKGEIKNTKI